MKKTFLSVLTVAIFLTGCTADRAIAHDPALAVGADKDQHGCIASAGYKWCGHTKACERPWELAKKAEFEDTLSNFEEYCQE